MVIFLARTNCSEECRMVNMQIVAKSTNITVMHRSETYVHCSSDPAIRQGTGMQRNFNDHSRFGVISSCNRRNYL